MAPPPSDRALSARPLLCLVTDRHRLVHASGDDGREELAALVGAAARAGVDLIQIRERDLDARRLCELVRACLHAAHGSQSRILVNDRVDVALASGAAGVHLRSDSPATARIRAIVPAGFLIGRSIHSARDAAAAEEGGGLDYLIAGTVFPSPSKSTVHGWLGLDGLRAVVERVELPVLAIGGVNLSAAAAIAATGAAGLAAISLFADAAANHADLARLVRSIKDR